MSATTTTSAGILHHTAIFLSETLSQTHLRHRLISTFLKRLTSPLLKSLTFVSQTIENAVSTTSPSLRASSLRLAEKLLLSNPANAFSSFLLSLVYHLSHRPLDASLSLLDLFESEPSLCRLEIAPFLFQELFLVHFSEILEWYNLQRSRILSSMSLSCSSNYDTDDRSTSSTKSIMSKMSAGQASALKDLERDYGDLLEDNCRIFVRYFKELVRNEGGKEINSPPTILFNKGVSDGHEPLCVSDGDEENVKSQGFESSNRRYNVMILFLSISFFLF